MSVETRLCPYCREEIKALAVKCKHCGSMLPDIGTGTPVPSAMGAVVPAWAAGAETIPAGTEIREYRICRLLGTGGMGEVYEAEHTYTEQRVALKAVHPGLMADHGVRRRFLEEGRVMAGLKHQNIVTLHAFFEEVGRFFLVIGYLQGRDLDKVLHAAEAAGRPLSIPAVLKIARCIASGLSYAHERNPPVIHRDIKPANIIVDKTGCAVITDFGIAKALGREKLTRTAGMVGTFEYMSPEQVTGAAVSPATDVYAMGILLYRMFAGTVPFPQTSPTGIEVMDAHRNQEPPDVRVHRPDCPTWLAGLVCQCLSKEPANRFAGGAGLLGALQAGTAPPQSAVPPAPQPPLRPAPPPPLPKSPSPAPVPSDEPWPEPDPLPAGRPKPLPWALGGLGVLLLVLLLVWRPWEASEETPQSDDQNQALAVSEKGPDVPLEHASTPPQESEQGSGRPRSSEPAVQSEPTPTQELGSGPGAGPGHAEQPEPPPEPTGDGDDLPEPGPSADQPASGSEPVALDGGRKPRIEGSMTPDTEATPEIVKEKKRPTTKGGVSKGPSSDEPCRAESVGQKHRSHLAYFIVHIQNVHTFLDRRDGVRAFHSYKKAKDLHGELPSVVTSSCKSKLEEARIRLKEMYLSISEDMAARGNCSSARGRADEAKTLFGATKAEADTALRSCKPPTASDLKFREIQPDTSKNKTSPKPLTEKTGSESPTGPGDKDEANQPPQGFDALMKAGNDLRRSNPSKALTYYLEALKQRPNHPETNYKVGDCYYRLGEHSEASGYFEKSISLTGFRAAYTRLAQGQAAIGNRKRAVEVLEEGLQRYPGDALMESLLSQYH